MTSAPVELATRPLTVLTGGPGAPAAELLELVSDELRALAGGCLRGEGAVHTLQLTALVHEAYLRVADRTGTSIEDRARPRPPPSRPRRAS